MTPYDTQPEKAFWSPAVGKRDCLDIEGLWDPKAPLRKSDGIATFGSCFAQHIGRALDRRGYSWMCTEPAPSGASPETERKFNYGVFTARTGNIYTVSLLHQWCSWALDGAPVPDEVWEKDGRFYDPFRPNIEPDGFASAEEMIASRAETIRAFGEAVRKARFFVFTLGLTESWWHATEGYEYPMCPGTVAGTFDPETHVFQNQRFQFIKKQLNATIRLMRRENPRLRFILTVSPVPLTATATDKHVLVATMQSKSILRAVAAEVAEDRAAVDYFPSYEIINSAPYGGRFFEANQRGVRMTGVDHVMNMFFSCLDEKFGRRGKSKKDEAPRQRPADSDPETDPQDDLVCEEMLLDSFSNKAG